MTLVFVSLAVLAPLFFICSFLKSNRSSVVREDVLHRSFSHLRTSGLGRTFALCALVATVFGGASPQAFGATQQINQFFCQSGSALGAASDVCTVYLSAASASGSPSVSLSSSDPAVTLPATVAVPAGATSVQFTANLASVTTTQNAVMTATLGASSKTYQLTLFQAISTLSLGSPTLAFSGYVPLNTTVSQPYTVTSSGTIPLTITAANVSGAGFTVSGATFPMTLNPGAKATIQVQFDPTVAGSVTGQIVFVSNSSTGNKVTALTALGGPPPVSQFVCKSGSALGAATDLCTVYLSAASASGPATVSLSSSDPAVTLPATVTVPAGATSAQFTATLASVTTTQAAVLTASSGASSKTYQLTLFQALSTLTVETPNVAFSGYVPLNTTVSQSVTVMSSGTIPLTITAANVSGAGFTVSGATFPMTLNPGAKATIQVQFDPAAAGSVTGQIVFVSNSSTGNKVTALTALGGPPPVSQFVCKSGSALGAATDLCTVYLSAASASGPATVSLSSSDPAVTLPATVTVPAGATSAQFAATLASVTTTQAAVLTASSGASSKTYQLTLFQALSTLTVETPNVAFSGYVPLNTTVSQSVTVMSSGTIPLTITAANVSGAGFTVSGATFPMTLNPGAKATIQVQFDPAAAGSVTGQIVFVSNSSTGNKVTALTALGGPPPVSQFVCKSGSALGAATDLCTVYLSAGAIDAVNVSLSSNNPSLTLPATVAVPANTTSVQFTANLAAVTTTQNAVITASSGASSKTYQLTLFQALSTLFLKTSTVALGYVPVNGSASLPVYVLSSGTTPLTISAANVSGAGFQLPGTTFPMTLNPGQTATIQVQFSPTVAGSVSGQIVFVSNSSTGNAVTSLSATGTAVGKFPGTVLSTIVPPNPTTPISTDYSGMTIYWLASQTPSASTVLTPFPQYPISTLRLWDVDYWSNLEHTSGKYDWVKMDGDVAAGQQNGVKDFIFTFGQTPPWASTNPTDPCPNGEGPGTCSPPNMDAYDAFATSVVQRYCGKVQYYEPWNEPNNAQFWDGTNAQMLTLAQHLYTIAKDPANCGCTDGSCSPNGGVNPNKVLLPPIGSTAPASVAWLDSYLDSANLANPYADIAAFHGYVWNGYQPEQIVTGVQLLRQTLGKYGLSNLELWDTEVSWEYNYFFTEEQQTSWLMRSYTTEAALGVSRFVWYAYDNCTWGTLWTDSTCANNQSPANQTGPAGGAYGTVENWLTGANLTQCQQYQSGLWACELQRPNNYDAWMLWSSNGSSLTVPVPASLGLTTYRNWQNQVNALPSEVTVSDLPMILE